MYWSGPVHIHARSRGGLSLVSLGVGSMEQNVAVSCCEQRDFCNVVLPNGDVQICCMDFSLQYKIGNLLVTPLAKIQYSHGARAFRATMASPSDGICNHCIYAKPAAGHQGSDESTSGA